MPGLERCAENVFIAALCHIISRASSLYCRVGQLAFLLNMAGYSWKLKQKRLHLMQLPWVLHFSGILRPKNILTKTSDSYA